MILAVAAQGAGALVQPLRSDGIPDGDRREVSDLAALIRDHPAARWVWANTEAVYPALLDAAVRVPAVATAPPHGLTLVAVGYPPESELADQTHRARRWRGR